MAGSKFSTRRAARRPGHFFSSVNRHHFTTEINHQEFELFINGDIKLSSAVMAHPKRVESAKKLRDSCPALGLQLALDPDPDGPPATIRTARLAWGLAATTATHHLVLQDDTELCSGFAEAVTRAVAAAPNRPLAFFTSWQSRTAQMVRLAALVGKAWAPMVDRFVPPQALVLPTALAEEFAERAERLDLSVTDGKAMTMFLRSRKAEALVSAPNLVEHTQVPSLLGHDLILGPRPSVLFAGDERPDLSELGAVLGRTAVPHFDGVAGHAVVYSSASDDPATATATPAHNALGQAGMTGTDIVDTFLTDVRHVPASHPDAVGLGWPFVFQLWLTMFMLGTTAASVLSSSDPAVMDEALRRPLARKALGTFPSGLLCSFLPQGKVPEMNDQLLPLCEVGLRSGFIATGRWPELAQIAYR